MTEMEEKRDMVIRYIAENGISLACNQAIQFPSDVRAHCWRAASAKIRYFAKEIADMGKATYEEALAKMDYTYWHKAIKTKF